MEPIFSKDGTPVAREEVGARRFHYGKSAGFPMRPATQHHNTRHKPGGKWEAPVDRLRKAQRGASKPRTPVTAAAAAASSPAASALRRSARPVAAAASPHKHEVKHGQWVSELQFARAQYRDEPELNSGPEQHQQHQQLSPRQQLSLTAPAALGAPVPSPIIPMMKHPRRNMKTNHRFFTAVLGDQDGRPSTTTASGKHRRRRRSKKHSNTISNNNNSGTYSNSQTLPRPSTATSVPPSTRQRGGSRQYSRQSDRVVPKPDHHPEYKPYVGTGSLKQRRPARRSRGAHRGPRRKKGMPSPSPSPSPSPWRRASDFAFAAFDDGFALRDVPIVPSAIADGGMPPAADQGYEEPPAAFLGAIIPHGLHDRVAAAAAEAAAAAAAAEEAAVAAAAAAEEEAMAQAREDAGQGLAAPGSSELFVDTAAPSGSEPSLQQQEQSGQHPLQQQSSVATNKTPVSVVIPALMSTGEDGPVPAAAGPLHSSMWSDNGGSLAEASADDSAVADSSAAQLPGPEARGNSASPPTLIGASILSLQVTSSVEEAAAAAAMAAPSPHVRPPTPQDLAIPNTHIKGAKRGPPQPLRGPRSRVKGGLRDRQSPTSPALSLAPDEAAVAARVGRVPSPPTLVTSPTAAATVAAAVVSPTAAAAAVPAGTPTSVTASAPEQRHGRPSAASQQSTSFSSLSLAPITPSTRVRRQPSHPRTVVPPQHTSPSIPSSRAALQPEQEVNVAGHAYSPPSPTPRRKGEQPSSTELPRSKRAKVAEPGSSMLEAPPPSPSLSPSPSPSPSPSLSPPPPPPPQQRRQPKRSVTAQLLARLAEHFDEPEPRPETAPAVPKRMVRALRSVAVVSTGGGAGAGAGVGGGAGLAANMPDTVIPSEFHVYEESPMPPTDKALAPHAQYDEASQMWRLRVWPKIVPTMHRQDVARLDTWHEMMKDRIVQEIDDDENLINDLNRLDFMCFYEIFRQVLGQCEPRGQLLHRLWSEHQALLQRLTRHLQGEQKQRTKRVQYLERKNAAVGKANIAVMEKLAVVKEVIEDMKQELQRHLERAHKHTGEAQPPDGVAATASASIMSAMTSASLGHEPSLGGVTATTAASSNASNDLTVSLSHELSEDSDADSNFAGFGDLLDDLVSDSDELAEYAKRMAGSDSDSSDSSDDDSSASDSSKSSSSSSSDSSSDSDSASTASEPRKVVRLAKKEPAAAAPAAAQAKAQRAASPASTASSDMPRRSSSSSSSSSESESESSESESSSGDDDSLDSPLVTDGMSPEEAEAAKKERDEAKQQRKAARAEARAARRQAKRDADAAHKAAKATGAAKLQKAKKTVFKLQQAVDRAAANYKQAKQYLDMMKNRETAPEVVETAEAETQTNEEEMVELLGAPSDQYDAFL